MENMIDYYSDNYLIDLKYDGKLKVFCTLLSLDLQMVKEKSLIKQLN